MKTLLRWLDARFPLTSTWTNYFSQYQVPKNLNFLYVFGFLALVVLLNQFISGLWLTMFYTPSVDKAFSSIEYIMREVNFGWLLRYMHSTGASAFFIILYIHIFRGLLYGSYQRPRELVWLLGMFLYVLLMAEAFFGYLLPWGQLSYWGAQVITSLVGAIPYIGQDLLLWVRGDYAVSDVTLHRFFALHVIAIPFLILLFSYCHVVALHKVGSNNPRGIDIKENGDPLEMVPFHPYYTVKDLFAGVIFLILFFSVIFFFPSMGGYFLEAANFIPANPLITPEDITPLWYLSPFYAMLRGVPNQQLGIVCMAFAILLPLFLPWLDYSPVRAMRYKGKWSHCFFVLFILSFVMLGYLGLVSVTSFTLWASRVSMFFYFAFFLLMPNYSRLEHTKPLSLRID